MSINDALLKFLKGETGKVAFDSAARTASGNSNDLTNETSTGCHITIDMTAVPSVETVVFTVQGKDEVSGKYYDILASAAIVATGTVVLKIYPGLTAIANLTATDIIPRVFRVKTTHSASGSFTYSVGVSLVG